MVINLGAYAAEIIRAGIEATPRGQIEAAISLALNRVQTFRAGGAAAGAQEGVARHGQPDHHRDAGLGRLRADLHAGAELRGQPDPEPQFPRVRGLHRHGVIYLLLSVALRHGLNWLAARFLFGS
jgi:polar amino acid transport system permease protein